jgi:DNA-binding transcriptional LysR family regulator
MDGFNCLRSFVEVVETKSFTKSAEKRYISTSALSRQISWLENRIGIELIARTTRSLALTEEGAVFYEQAKKLLDDFDRLAEFAKHKQASLTGNIRLTMPFSFTSFDPVTEVLNHFLNLHPDVSLQLDYTNYIQDLMSENIDIAFRSDPKNLHGYEKIKLTQYQIGYFASPNYLKNHPMIKKPEDLRDHNYLVNVRANFADWSFTKGMIKAKGNLKTDSAGALTQFAILGLGIIRASKIYVQQALTEGTLVPVLEPMWNKPLDIYLLYRNRQGTPYRILSMVDFIVKKFD